MTKDLGQKYYQLTSAVALVSGLIWICIAAIGWGQPPVSRGSRAASDQERKPPVLLPAQRAGIAATEFDGAFAYQILKEICDLGSRVSASEPMRRQQEMIKQHFTELGAEIIEQRFQVPHPQTRQPTTLTNLIVRFHPQRKQRILLCCHYDTRPFPDRDPRNPRGIFLGANDGASGVGLFFELGRHLPEWEGKYGIDLIFFDGEEFVWQTGVDPMFLGSEFFARTYANKKWDVKYAFGILVDMIGDRDLQIYYEKNSLQMAAKLCKSIWSVAAELGVKEFIQEPKHQIRDDHLPLNLIAGIMTCDIIDFDYPNPQAPQSYWHTEQDIPANCSAESLEKVGRVLLEWLRQLQKL